MEHESAFLRQAHLNNWHKYLQSLGSPAESGWDVCVLTASDEAQAAIYRRQLDWRREASLLPRGTYFTVVPDPGGRRIGSGGATLRVLRDLAAGELGYAASRALIIHSGGDSRRLPHCSALGKLFARVPRALPDGRASTIFDEFLIGLSGLAGELPAGALIASGDVLIIFDHLQLSFQRRGVIGVAAAAPAALALRHGVYVSEPGSHRVRAYLHKSPAEEIERWGALQPDGSVQIDTGLVWLDAATVAGMSELAERGPVAAAWAGRGQPSPLNLYGDLLLPLSQSTTLEAYLADASDGSATPGIQAARAVIWERLRGTPLTVERLQPAVFVHFGTSSEYWRMAAASPNLAATCGWERQVASWLSDKPKGPAPVLVNAYVDGAFETSQRPLLVVDSSLRGPVKARGACLLTGVETARTLDLSADVVVHQMPVRGGFVTRVYGLDDDPKAPWDGASATFIGRPWRTWLAEAGLKPERLWPDVPPEERTLWNAELYPVCDSRDESLELSLALQEPGAAPAGWRERWQDSLRLSLAESFVLADGAALLAAMASLEDKIAARRFCAAVEAEQPAAEAKALLGSSPAAISRRCQLAASWAQRAAPLLQLRGYKALAEATGSYLWEERAFRTLAALIAESRSQENRGENLLTPGSFTSPGSSLETVRVQAAARIDFGGGWTDTPPYSIERGGTVLNAAVILNGAYPIVVEATPLHEPRLILESRDIEAVFEPERAGEVLAYANPADPFALLKAALVLRGLVPRQADPRQPLAELLAGNGGLRLSTQTTIPRGSGLGTSSIMAGAVLACLDRLAGERLPERELFDDVLCLEQMLTTGGGWQDQVGGLTGGVKLTTSEPGLPQRLAVAPLRLSANTVAELARRLVLVYTGQQRLAKNLLRAIMGRWLARDREMVWLLGEIARLALAMRDALECGDVDGFGALLGEHWELNKRMDPGCSNPYIDRLFETMRPHVVGGKLAGAGGGGFAIVIVKDSTPPLVAALRGTGASSGVSIWPSSIPSQGLR